MKRRVKLPNHRFAPYDGAVDVVVNNTIALLVAAIAVALIARRLALPYTVGLVIAGIALALARVNTGVVLTHDLIFSVILPPLLFEAAINLRWAELRRDAFPILVLALLGTMLAAAVVALGVGYFLRWPAASAMLFGVLIAATDPVAVIAMFKDNGVGGRLRLLVECESLFNDGVAAVLFTLVLTTVEGLHGQSVPAALGLTLLKTVGGGICVGLACAAAALFVAGRTSDHLLESTLTTVAAYGSFLLAEHFHMSGVLATVTAGLLTGNLGVLADDEQSRMTTQGREFVLGLWEFIAFIANSLVFLLIGLSVGGVAVRDLDVLNLALIIALVLFSRAVTVYPLCLLFARSHWRIPFHAQHVLWWGGLRGALGLALALSLPDSLPLRGEILIATFAVVVFSVVLQGLTMPWVLKAASN
jgi:CPA1 family monovalent cation:H+ antiporter